ncbi:putative Ig domain-containing protein [Streptomyces sp. 1222.5]|uniref:putative Ig domain-containing protein n=1 Tax=Streptomyces sp. 1222.5 TaxID=1881026 RepID=UPI003EB98415
MVRYAEEIRESVKQGYEEVASAAVIKNCSEKEVTESLGWSSTNTATHTVGASASLAVKADFGFKPFGVGFGGSVTVTVGASYSYAWGTAYTRNGTATMPVPSGKIGWWAYAKYNGLSHGIMTVEIPVVKSGVGGLVWGQTGTYQFPTHIEGDLPRPADPTLAALVEEGLVPRTKDMSATDRHDCTPVDVIQPSDQTSVVGQPASLQIRATSIDGTNNFAPLTYSATGLPGGMHINQSTGLISGTPTTVETMDVSVKVTDRNGNYNTLGTKFQWRVGAAPTPTPTPTPTASNLALGKYVWANSSEPGRPAGQLVDGNANSYWQSLPGQSRNTLLVDLAGTKTVNKAVLKIPASLVSTGKTTSWTVTVQGMTKPIPAGTTPAESDWTNITKSVDHINQSAVVQFTSGALQSAVQLVPGSQARYVRVLLTLPPGISATSQPVAQLGELEVW